MGIFNSLFGGGANEDTEIAEVTRDAARQRSRETSRRWVSEVDSRGHTSRAARLWGEAERAHAEAVEQSRDTAPKRWTWLPQRDAGEPPGEIRSARDRPGGEGRRRSGSCSRGLSAYSGPEPLGVVFAPEIAGE